MEISITVCMLRAVVRLARFFTIYTDMTLSILPGTPWSPPLCLFVALDYGGEALAYLLFLTTFVAAYSYYFLRHCKCCNSKCSCLLDFFVAASTTLSVKMFPGLFKVHMDWQKDQSGNRIVTRVPLLFLNKRVTNNDTIIANFSFLALAILSSALLAFFRYTPISISEECIVKDGQGRGLFCYTNESNWPVDCAAYNTTKAEEVNFICYTISMFHLGIAGAAAAVLAKLATVGITIYIKISECLFKRCIGNKGTCSLMYYRACLIIMGLLLLALLGTTDQLVIAKINTEQLATAEGRQLRSIYITYAVLPFMILPPLLTIICNLHQHCHQEEGISYCQCQLPNNNCMKVCDASKEPDFRVKTNMCDDIDVEKAWGDSK